MGCTSTKSEILEEEQAIQEGQLYLLYSYIHCKDVDHIYRKYSFSGRVNTSQFSEISKKLNLASVNMVNDPKLQKFYDSFKIQEDYNLNQLLILGILTSQGSAIDKAKLLFEIKDETSTKWLKKSEIEDLVKQIIKISVEHLPSIYVINENIKTSDAAILAYTKRITSNIEVTESIMVKQFMGGSKEETISLSDFLNNFRVPETAKFLKPEFIRKSILEHSTKLPELINK